MTLAAALGVWGLGSAGRGAWIAVKAELAQLLLERAWVETAAGRRKVKPWPWADTWPVARLEIPRLDVNLIVLAGDSGRTLAFGPGHSAASAPPGAEGLSIISGHRDTHFATLRHLKPGDTIVVHTPDAKRTEYTVRELSVADARDTGFVFDDDGRRRMALVTCWPFDALQAGGPLRFVAGLVAERQAAIMRQGHAFFKQ